MSYPGYTPAPSYGYGPPPKRRGMKRIIFGILGLIANGLGLILMPFLGGFIGIILAAVGMMDLEASSPDGGTFEMSLTKVVTVWVPSDEAAGATCEFEGDGITAEPAYTPDDETTVEVDGVAYTQIYSVQSDSTTTATMHCEGASSVAYSTMGIMPTLILAGVGVLIPIVLGLAALVLLIWGIIARVRS